MDAKHRVYSVDDSDARIVQILDSGAAFDDAGGIPNSGALTYENGYYVDCTAIFIDIRDSSKLSEHYAQRRTLGKLYRAYVSECVAVLNGNPRCSQVFIQGDCVSAVFDTPNREAVNDVFRLVASLNSVVKLLNFRLQRRGLTAIRVGIGIDTGRALMLKAGFHGSGINDVIWMGDVLNRASHLCHAANKDGRKVIQVSAEVKALIDQQAMSADGRTFLSQVWAPLLDPVVWQCDVVNVGMEQHFEVLTSQLEPRSGLFGLGGLLSGLAAPPPAPPSINQGLLASLFAPPPAPPPVDPANILLDLIRKQR